MRVSHETLIRRLQERNADRERATDGHIHRRKPFPAVTARALRDAEKAIGLSLPDLLRAIYREVGNGGFGPAYGIVGIRGGCKLDNQSLESCYRGMLRLEQQNPVWRWPKRLLPIANYGCGMWSCVDCAFQRLPMILWDPSNLDAGLEDADARLNWANAFWDQERSLPVWLSAWIAGRPEPEPRWASGSWMKKRLGYTMPK